MTMMISKFHRLIQSRLLWGIFLVVIVFSFVIWGMVWPSQRDRAGQADAVGTLDGETVGFNEFRAADRSIRLSRALALGRDAASTPETEVLLRQLAWQRVATLREARKLGITASDQELVSVLRANFSTTNGVYDPQRYAAFLQNMVSPLGFSVGLFEQHLREEIIIQKLANLIGRQALVTPLEIQRTFDTLLDSFTVEYAALKRDDVAANVKVTPDDARELFNANPEAFTIPEQRRIQYAAFPIADFTDTESEISEDDIQDYYELHIEDYTTQETDTNGQPRAIVAELSDVRDGIANILRKLNAVDHAEAAANELVFRAIPDRDGTVPDFAVEAEKAGHPAVALAPFAHGDDPVPDGGVAFVLTAFELAPNAYDRVSSPVVGEDNVYILYLDKVLEPRVPEFEEVEERALDAARQKAIGEALMAKGGELRNAITAGLAAGKTLAESAAGFAAEISTTEPFTGLSGASSTNVVEQALVRAVVGYNQGEITEPVLLPDGLLVAHVKQRTSPDEATFDAYQPEISSAIRARRAQGLFHDWQTGLLAPGRFTDLQRRPDSADDEDESDDTDAEQPAPYVNEAEQYL